MVTKTFSVMATCVLKSEPEITHLPGFDILKSVWQQVHVAYSLETITK